MHWNEHGEAKHITYVFSYIFQPNLQVQNMYSQDSIIIYIYIHVYVQMSRLIT